jgi:hypothetical protein
MKKLKSILITVSALLLLTGAPGTHCLAGTPVCYLPLISYDPTPPPPTITPVTPELVVGSWEMINDGDPDPGKTGEKEFFLHIGSDNNLAINDYPSDNPHLFGSWSIVDGIFYGPFENPNVGTGELVGTIVDGVFKLEFREFWHTPTKIIKYTANRV